MIRSLYIETTIPSFYYTLRTDAESIARMNWTRRWWKEFSGSYELVTSSAVIIELERGRGKLTPDRLKLLESLELLPITEEVIMLAQVYIDRKLMPADLAGVRCIWPLRRFIRRTTYLPGTVGIWRMLTSTSPSVW